MNPILLMGAGVSLKKHMFLIACILLFLVFMPMAAVFAIVSPTSLYTNPTGFYTGEGNPQDLYAWGNCTYWAALLRIQNGDPVPNTWGNANTWGINAKKDGWLVDDTPSFGAVMVSTAGPLGHVAFVEAVDPITGAWTISEMNALGLNMTDTRTLSASVLPSYSFIHDQISLGAKP